MNEYLKEYLLLLKSGEFFEAHEVLEEPWQKIRKTDNNLKWAYKGLINAAVALELKKRNKKGYEKVWGTFEKYKAFYKINAEVYETYLMVKNMKP